MTLNLGEIWAYRELFYFLAWRDIKVRYRQTLLGVAWAVIQPGFMTLVFTAVFGHFARVPSDGLPYSVFAFAGLVPWMLFASAVHESSQSLVNNANLLTKVYFPRVLAPAAAAGTTLVDFAVSFAVLMLLMGYFRVAVTWKILLLPLLVFLTFVLALGVGIRMAAWNVQYRDVRYMLPFVIQLWMFATPVIYPVSVVPERWRAWLALNPLTGIVSGFRSALFGRDLDWAGLLVSAAITLAVFVSSLRVFRRMERTFSDLV